MATTTISGREDIEGIQPELDAFASKKMTNCPLWFSLTQSPVGVGWEHSALATVRQMCSPRRHNVKYLEWEFRETPVKLLRDPGF